MRRGPALGLAIVAAIIATTTRASDVGIGDRGRFIELWVRASGSANDGPSHRLMQRRFDLDRARSREADLYDAQYDRVARYRGLSLRTLLDDLHPDAGLDLAILHFANGMAVPVSFRDRQAMVRLDPFLARAYEPAFKAPFSTAFAPIHADGPGPDPRPTQFTGNKVVVLDRWHPDVPAVMQPTFSPWTKVDTLVGVELVASRPYYAQFDVGGEPAVQRGLALYRGSCQFCHGARYVGATFGWDFVEAPPVHDPRDSAANLYHNIAYRPRNATELGLLMPALASLTEEDAGCLQRWLQAIATRPMPPYVAPRTVDRMSPKHSD